MSKYEPVRRPVIVAALAFLVALPLHLKGQAIGAFVLYSNDRGTFGEAAQVAAKLIDAMAQPCRIECYELVSTVSIDLALPE